MRRVLAALLLALVWSGVASAQSSTGSGSTATGTSSPQLVVVCGPAASGSTASTICPADMNGNPQTPVLQQGYILSSADYAALQAAIAPFDWTLAGSCFGAGAGLVISTYFLAFPLGVLARFLGSA